MISMEGGQISGKAGPSVRWVTPEGGKGAQTHPEPPLPRSRLFLGGIPHLTQSLEVSMLSQGFYSLGKCRMIPQKRGIPCGCLWLGSVFSLFPAGCVTLFQFFPQYLGSGVQFLVFMKRTPDCQGGNPGVLQLKPGSRQVLWFSVQKLSILSKT